MIDCFRTVSLSDPAFEHDNLRAVTVRSPALRGRGDVSLWIPGGGAIGAILILLHGVYGSHWSWTLQGGVHRTAQRLLSAGEIAPMVIAMPSDGLKWDGSAYLTYPGSEDVEQWIVEEVPRIARIAAPSLRPDAAVVIGGLSMGGYGALRLGAKYPRHFRGISAHSAITDISEMSLFVQEPVEAYLRAAPREELSPLYWLRKHRDQLPELSFDCGSDDPLIGGNRALHEALRLEGIAHSYEEFSGGHDWSHWSEHVARTLRFANRVGVAGDAGISG